MILLDSDVVVDILRGQPSALGWLSGVSVDEELVLPGFVAMELIFGCVNPADHWATDRFIRICEIAWLNQSGCETAMRMLRHVRPRVALGVLDALIAQTAIELDAPLHTLNARHFRAVPNLAFVQPYRR